MDGMSAVKSPIYCERRELTSAFCCPRLRKRFLLCCRRPRSPACRFWPRIGELCESGSSEVGLEWLSRVSRRHSSASPAFVLTDRVLMLLRKLPAVFSIRRYRETRPQLESFTRIWE